MPTTKQTTIKLDNLSVRALREVLRDPRIKPIAIDYYATGAIVKLLEQLPEPSETDTPSK